MKPDNFPDNCLMQKLKKFLTFSPQEQSSIQPFERLKLKSMKAGVTAINDEKSHKGEVQIDQS